MRKFVTVFLVFAIVFSSFSLVQIHMNRYKRTILMETQSKEFIEEDEISQKITFLTATEEIVEESNPKKCYKGIYLYGLLITPINISFEEEIQEEFQEKTVTSAYTDEDLELLAHVINAEANCWYNPSSGIWEYCSDRWQVLVGLVVLNRIKSDEFPNTMREVIYQKGQYACAWDGNLEQEPSDRAYENARKALEGEVEIPENIVFQAQFNQGGGVYEKIGNTYFCYR